jgi:hypothetical protein
MAPPMPRSATRRRVAVVVALCSAFTVCAVEGPGLVASSASDGGAAAVKFPRVVKGGSHIRANVRKFRLLLGHNNGGGPQHHLGGRRELSWDAVPDKFAAPHALPGRYFDASTAPRARGAVLRTPGDHVAVSADANNPSGAAVRFGDINPTYTQEFRTFSPERLFSPVGSNVVNLTFRVPGTKQRAAVRGFGAVYTDVDRKESAAFTYFDSRGRSLGTFAIPVSKNKLSFLGVVFRRARVARVRIKYGNRKLGPDDGGKYDLAVMDDFIYGEPQPLGK